MSASPSFLAAHDGAERARDCPAALAIDHVSLRFGGVAVLGDVSLSVADGEVVGLIGPNGAGKSSLLNVMSGFYRPDAGRVSIGGRSVTNWAPHRIAHAGVVRTFQNLGLLPGLSVLENVLAGRMLHHRAGGPSYLLGLARARGDDSRNRAQALALLARLGLADKAGLRISTLSYGAQKRVELARALAMEPRTLLLDEPLAGMNREEKAEMAAAIRAVNRDHGTTIVLIEHDIGIVMELSQRLVVLDRGRVIADGTPAEIAADPRVIAAYLGTGAAQGGRAAA